MVIHNIREFGEVKYLVTEVKRDENGKLDKKGLDLMQENITTEMYDNFELCEIHQEDLDDKTVFHHVLGRK